MTNEELKSLIDAVTFYDTFWLQGLIQLFFLWGIKYCVRFEKWNLLRKIVIADMVIASLLNIPLYESFNKIEIDGVLVFSFNSCYSSFRSWNGIC